MKARITHLKAPWPSGAVVGAVVMFAAGSIPSWAVGKCELAGDDETPTHVVPAGGEKVEPVGSDAEQVREEARQFIDRQRAEFERHAQDLQAKLDAKSDEFVALQARKLDADAKAAELESALAAAVEGQKAAVKAADDLQAKLTAATSKKK